MGKRAVMAVLTCVLVCAAAGRPAAGAPRAGYLLKIDGAIGPMTSHQVARAIRVAEQQDAPFLILVFDTPGGLLASTRKAVQAILTAKVPVIGFVAPQGAQCASAGTFLALACHVAAMAPATNIGAAHPVSLMGGESSRIMEEKAVNDTVSFIKSIAAARGRNVSWAEKAVRESVSATADEALRAGVIDLVAGDVPDLLEKLDGRTVETAAGKRVLETAGAAVREPGIGFREKILGLISDPNVAYILLIIGIWGIILEFSHPGTAVPGIVGTVCIILGLFALQTIPLSLTGVILLFVSLVFFAIEAVTPGFGLFMIAGVITMLLGSFMFVRPGAEASVKPSVVWGAVLSSGLCLGVIVWFAGNARRRRVTTGKEGIAGEVGKAMSDLDPEGMVFVHGEDWRARSVSGRIPRGARVRVAGMEGLLLVVEKAEGNGPGLP